jgi:hypothetical protein
MWQRSKIPLFLLLLLSLVLLIGFLLVSGRRSGGIQTAAQSPAGLECRAFCSDTNAGVSVAEVTFSSSEDRLSQLALEVTVYKDGFALGRLARVAPIRAGQKFTIIQPEDQRVSAPGFDRLALAELRVQREQGLVTARVEGLDAGLNYFWRIRPVDGSGPASEITVCRAPICPVDSEPPQIPSPR